MVFSLFFGVLEVPQALAGFWSSILGTDVSASSGISSSSPNSQSSQNMSLLQANVYPDSVLSAKPSKDDTNTVATDKNVNILSNNALVPATSPVGITGTDSADTSNDQVSVYVVRSGDSISQIADMFGVSVNTILWANNMKKGDKLVEGDVLFVLPVSGLQHTVTKGQTIQSIAKLYKVDPSDITSYNGIAEDAQLSIGDTLMIPNAEKSSEGDKPVKDLKASIAKDNQYYQAHPTKTLSGYFIDPVPGYRLSQGIHDNNAVDLAIAKGTPIHSAASGKVIFARTGYNGGFGNLVIISHPNGSETLYAHQSKIATYTGAQVTQGDVIGYVGSTGHSTGPHLHFEVHGARNPGADGSWAN